VSAETGSRGSRDLDLDQNIVKPYIDILMKSLDTIPRGQVARDMLPGVLRMNT